MGVVPLGVPLISGPAVLTTLVIAVLGPAGTKGLSKVTALILAAIAVMMIRVGVQSVLTGTP